MFREIEHNRILCDIALATNMAILCTIIDSIMILLILFHVLTWKNPVVQLGLCGTWGAVSVMLLCRYIFKKYLRESIW